MFCKLIVLFSHTSNTHEITSHYKSSRGYLTLQNLKRVLIVQNLKRTPHATKVEEGTSYYIMQKFMLPKLKRISNITKVQEGTSYYKISKGY